MPKTHKCRKCDKSFPRHSNLRRHEENNVCEPSKKGTFQCTPCGRTFSRRDTYRQHMELLHSGARPVYSCAICAKRFNDPTEKKEHAATHQLDGVFRVVKSAHKNLCVIIRCVLPEGVRQIDHLVDYLIEKLRRCLNLQRLNYSTFKVAFCLAAQFCKEVWIIVLYKLYNNNNIFRISMMNTFMCHILLQWSSEILFHVSTWRECYN